MAKKGATRVAGKTKKQLLEEAIAEAVGAGKELYLESVDFSDPNRPKTCLEVDFPILPINHVAAIEGNAGKPIYQLSKWWARRRSSVFRAMLIAAATKAPDDPGEAAKLVWDSYYGNHQNNEAFSKLKVADIFMGGGTTIVEGSRLGMKMFGNDLNPVAWFVVSEEMSQVDPVEVRELLDHIETEVKPQIMPFYACDCPRGHKGVWRNLKTNEIMSDRFDPLVLSQSERAEYSYNGPEIIYTFWAKHGPCQATGCGHRTPIMSTPVIAVKNITVKSWTKECSKCSGRFDIEQHEARMAPAAEFIVSSEEHPYAVLGADGIYSCPHCSEKHEDLAAKLKGSSVALGKAENKSVQLTLLTHPDWLNGTNSKTTIGETLGGSVGADVDSTKRWTENRTNAVRFIEFRGVLPDSIQLKNCVLKTNKEGGTIPKPSHFTCRSCGKANDVLDSMGKSGASGPVSEYAIQGYCPKCDDSGVPYGGRFFDRPNASRFVAAYEEWNARAAADLSEYWPRESLPVGFKTTYQRIPEHGYPRFVDMFNSRQLLVLSQLLKGIAESDSKYETKRFVLSAFQQYVRNQNMFCIWNVNADKQEPMFSNNYYHPKPNVVENCVFAGLGRSNWQSCAENCIDVGTWQRTPWEVVSKTEMQSADPALASQIAGKSIKVNTFDPLKKDFTLTCGSASQLDRFEDGGFDLVITDPPFGNNIQYAELSDLFYVWLRLFLRKHSKEFNASLTPKSVEAVVNPVRNPEDPDGFYQKMLTECWREAARVLKPAGILAFTFHHSEDEPWVAVLESLFQAGFYLEAAYPIRSDETKGEGAKPGTFGSQLIEYDIVHVCRKRIFETSEISWARLRKKILSDVRQLQSVLEHHQQAGLADADLQVIRRGKALEHYSKHYGKVYVEKGREFTVKEALAGINQLLDDQHDQTADIPPIDAEPYTRQFLRLFADTLSLPRDQLQKYLRGTGVSPNEFLERAWCLEKGKVFTMTPPLEQALKWKGAARKGLGKDLDQAMFLIGACYESSGINVNETLNNPNFVPHPALLDILDWFSRHGGDDTMKGASQTARQLYKKWLSNNEPKVKQVQQTLFDLMEDGE